MSHPADVLKRLMEELPVRLQTQMQTQIDELSERLQTQMQLHLQTQLQTQIDELSKQLQTHLQTQLQPQIEQLTARCIELSLDNLELTAKLSGANEKYEALQVTVTTLFSQVQSLAEAVDVALKDGQKAHDRIARATGSRPVSQFNSRSGSPTRGSSGRSFPSQKQTEVQLAQALSRVTQVTRDSSSRPGSPERGLLSQEESGVFRGRGGRGRA